jgi:twitching motility protein PilU
MDEALRADIDTFLQVMVDKCASDLFLSVGAPVKIKIAGETIAIGDRPLTAEDTRQLAYSIMTDTQMVDFEENLELNMALSIPAMGRFRVNVYRQRGDTAMVIRHIRSTIPSIPSLGLPPILQSLIMERQGLILVVGTTGSGKSTTLASMVDYRNENDAGHILTIEDPIEYVHTHKKSIVDQREVGLDTRSYPDALKNALREAPDVIVVGEIRDRETMRHALHYAETGNLCLSTLHANNANQTLERIVNFFPDAVHHELLMDLSQHLRAIVSQRLIPSLDQKLVPAVEVMLNSPYISNLIERNRINEIKGAMQQAELASMQTFDQSLYTLYKDGKITLDQALLNADSTNDLRLRLRLEDPDQFNSTCDLEISAN